MQGSRHLFLHDYFWKRYLEYVDIRILKLISDEHYLEYVDIRI